MKRYILLLFCLMLVLAGCRPEAPAATSAPTTVTTVPPTTEPTVPPVPIFMPEAVQKRQVSPSLLVLDNGSVLLHTWVFDEVLETSGVTLEVFDPISQTVTASASFENMDFYPVQALEGGRILFENYTDSCFTVTDSSLKILDETFSYPEGFGFFSRDLKYRYQLVGTVLCAVDLKTGQAEPIPLEMELRFSSLQDYDPHSNILLAAMRTDPYAYGEASVAIDLNTGKILAMNSDFGVNSFCTNGIRSTVYGPEGTVYIAYAAEDGSFLRSPEVPIDPIAFATPILGTDYMLSSVFTDEDTPATSDLILFSEEIRVCHLDPEVLPYGLSDAVALPDGRLLGTYANDDGQGICIVNPALLPFETAAQPVPYGGPILDKSIYEAYTRNVAIPELPEHLSQVRAEAQALEEKYGITVLLSNQCERPAMECDFPITTTDDLSWKGEDEAQYIHDALLELDKALALYPEGFFRQFRNAAGEAGFLVLLVEDIASENDAIGVAYEMNDWYPIAVDVTYGDMLQTYCHEIWHATETKLNRHDYALFNSGEWEALNPEGFAYSYDTTMDYFYYTEHTFTDGYGKESHFVDAYSRVNPKEDRARLMEYVMGYGEAYVADMMEAPALYEKLGILCRAVRQAFDTEGWENVYWERFHTPIAE